ncbi:MAG: histidine kinase [Bacteroidota bacterium]
MTKREEQVIGLMNIPLVYHLLYWLVYTVFWHGIFSPRFWSVGGFFTSSIYTMIHAVVSYFSIYWLVPRLWRQGRRLWFVLALVFSILVGALTLTLLLYLWFEGMSPETTAVFFEDFQVVMGSTLGSTFSGVTFAMVLFLLIQRRRMEQQQERLEQEKMSAELQFLRSQLDPHFLFNALNNIYFLIKKNPDAAAEALSGFSELLRYQIYQGQEERIPLREEFTYLQRYADLAALRLPHEAEVEVALEVPDSSVEIAPLLLLPLVENAFKHVDKDDAQVKIMGLLVEGELQFEVANTCVPLEEQAQGVTQTSSRVTSGIGLDNLSQRLALLYPGQANYIAWQEGNEYTAKLKIKGL